MSEALLSDPLTTAIAALDRFMPLARIVHLGSGPDQTLAVERATGAERILRLDPDPEGARELAQRAAGLAGVQVEAAAVRKDAGRATFHRLNLPMLSGLHEAAAFQALFPGLVCVAQSEVEVIDGPGLLALAGLGAQDEPAEAATRLLVCSAPQAAGDLIAALLPDGALAQFGHLLMRLPAQGWQADGGGSAETLLSGLEAAGFHVRQSWQDDPDFPLYRLQHVLYGHGPEVQARHAALEAGRRAAEDRAKSAEEARAKAEQESRRLREDLTMALRQQALLGADLTELRARHAALLEDHAARDRLLEELIEERARTRAEADPETAPAKPKPKSKSAGKRKKSARKSTKGAA